MPFNKSVILIFLSVSLSLPLSVSAAGGKHLVLNLKGTGAGYESTVPDINGDGLDDLATCFDVELFNQKNQQLIGTATDCLSDITPTGPGLTLVGTSFFRMANGELVTRGLTTVQGVLQPTVSPDGQVFTNMTGAADDGNAILSGSMAFATATGTSRLSGLVNLADFPNTATFDCLFVIDLE
jgi:hypothetical protein